MSGIGCLVCLERAARSRGVCPNCYRRQLKAIKAGLTTDDQLVAAGLRRPTKTRQEKNGEHWRYCGGGGRRRCRRRNST